MAFKDHFSGQSAAYQRYRPDYPPALFGWLAGQAPGRRLAIDVGTGNGQAAVALAAHFDAVIGAEPSAAQLVQARAHPRVTYRREPAESLSAASASADLVTVAQAAHWFDWPRFTAEAARVLRPGGVLAIWSYGNCEVTPAIDGLLADFFRDAIAQFDRTQDGVDLAVENSGAEINTLLEQIATVNKQINRAEISDNLANDYRDQRDLLQRDLARREAGAAAKAQLGAAHPGPPPQQPGGRERGAVDGDAVGGRRRRRRIDGRHAVERLGGEFRRKRADGGVDCGGLRNGARDIDAGREHDAAADHAGGNDGPGAGQPGDRAPRAALLRLGQPDQLSRAAGNGGRPITVTAGDGRTAAGNLQISSVAPALFSANASGQGVASATVLRLKGNGAQSYEPVAQYDSGLQRFVAVPIDIGQNTDQVFLVLFGSGIRNRSSLVGVVAQIGGTAAEVLYAGAQGGFAGLDQLNIRVPRSLAGRGEVDVVVLVDGKAANTVRVNIR